MKRTECPHPRQITGDMVAGPHGGVRLLLRWPFSLQQAQLFAQEGNHHAMSAEQVVSFWQTLFLASSRTLQSPDVHCYSYAVGLHRLPNS